MTTLTVWRFDSPDGAARAAAVLAALVAEESLGLHDAAVVEWEARRRKPRTRQLTGPGLEAELGEGFWGLLFGLTFAVPLLGAAVGSAGGAIVDALADVGIEDRFINRVRDQVTPGTSALVVLGPATDVDRVHAAVGVGPRADLIVAELDAAQETALREVFAD